MTKKLFHILCKSWKQASWVTGLFGPKRFFVLPATYWIGFVSDRLIQAPNKQAGYHSGSGTCRAKTISYLDISHFFVRVISYHFAGHLVPSFIMGFLKFINAILSCVKIYFLNRLLYIGKFYHISCNTVLFRLFNSVNPLCLYVCI